MMLIGMSDAKEIYEKARKQALRDASAATAKGHSGHLAVLQDSIGQCDILAYIRQPQREISLSRVVGTFTASRATSFSPGFLPLLAENTEFATKWERLVCAHLNEGIKDAVKVYAYKWRYYVVEGNKRVSVLKYYGGTGISADVTLLVPRLNDNDKDARRYHAYLEYLKHGLFFEIELSQAEKYEHLYRQEQRLLAEFSDNEELPDFGQLYRLFADSCAAVNADLPVGDTLAEYLHIYGFPIGLTMEQLREQIRQLEPQMALLSEQEPPRLILDTPEPTEEPFLRQLFGSRHRPHIVFVYGNGRTENNWLGAHERGRQALERELGDRVTTACIDGVNAENIYERLSAEAGDADLAFIVSSYNPNAILRFSLEHPDCLPLVYSPAQQDRRLNTYFGRYYEAVFLCGVAAGLCSKSRKIAYVTPQIAGRRNTSDINAFAQGVHTVSSGAEVILMTRGVRPRETQSCAEAVRTLAGMGVDTVLTPIYAGLSPEALPENVFSALISIDRNGDTRRCLAFPGWNWEAFYLGIVESYLPGGLDVLKVHDRGDTQVTGFWWGLGSGVIDFRYLPDILPPVTENLLRFLRSGIRRNTYNPFHGPIADIDGILRVPAHEDLSPLDILRMEWIREGITVVE